MKTKTHSIAMVFSYLILIVILLTTNPDNMPLPVITIPFIVIFLCLFLTADLIARYIFSNLKPKSRTKISMVLAVFPVLLIILQSINQLTVKDLIITVGLFLLLVFYFKKVDFIR